MLNFLILLSKVSIVLESLMWETSAFHSHPALE